MASRYPFPLNPNPTAFQSATDYTYEPLKKLPKSNRHATGLSVRALGPALQGFGAWRTLYLDDDGTLYTLATDRSGAIKGYLRENFKSTVPEEDWASRTLAR